MAEEINKIREQSDNLPKLSVDKANLDFDKNIIDQIEPQIRSCMEEKKPLFFIYVLFSFLMQLSILPLLLLVHNRYS